jgi:aspartokinase-like uncharacterized kinase
MWVIKLGGSLTEQAPDASELRNWLDMLAQEGAGRVVIVPGGGRFADAVRQAQAQWGFDDLAAHNMAVLAMAQTAHLLCSLNPALIRCDREQSLEGVLEQGSVALWSPIELQRPRADADTTWDVTSDSIALGLALRLGASRLVVVKSCAVDPLNSLDQLAAAGLVDRRFATMAHGASLQIDVVSHIHHERIRVALLDERRTNHR